MYDNIKYDSPIVYTPYIPLTVSKVTVNSKYRKLKCKWTSEIYNDMLEKMAKEISLEIDKEVLNNLVNEYEKLERIYEKEFIKEEEFSI